MSTMTPREIVQELDHHVIGQQQAKRSVAIALRNRWRRQQLPEDLRQEVTPKNILMIGPTGVGKTEIARRLARLSNAPFIKVEATKFTEVGYVGKEVDSIIRDLVDIAIKMRREQAMEQVKVRAHDLAIEHVLDVLIPPAEKNQHEDWLSLDEPQETERSPKTDGVARSRFREKLIKGDLDNKEIEIDLSVAPVGVEIMSPPGMEDMAEQLQGLFKNMGHNKTKKRKVTIKEALMLLTEREAQKLLNEDEIRQQGLEAVEQNGIVFVDEIDKVARGDQIGSADVSREGVQRDLLPLVEGCSVNTKYGMVKTDHILFIASGAFHLSKPSDLIPELQGRLPIRVELDALKAEDFERILVEPNASLTEQYEGLLKTEGIQLSFKEDAIRRIAEIACEVNECTENIGARRLHTVMECLLEDILFRAPEGETNLVLDEAYVNDKLNSLVQDEDLSRYIL